MSLFSILTDQSYHSTPGGDPPPPEDTFTQRVADANADWHLPLNDPSGSTATAEIGVSGTYENTVQLDVTSIVQFDTSGACTGFSGAAGGSAPHVRVPTPLTTAAFTALMHVQLDTLSTPKHVLLTRGSGAGNGSFSLEVLTNGQTRAFSIDNAGAVHIIVGTAGDVPEGQSVPIAYRRQSGVSPSQQILVNNTVVAEDTTIRTWATIPAGTIYIGTWWDGVSATLDPTDGLIGHVVGWESWVSTAVMQPLLLPQSVAWAVGVDGGEIVEDGSEVVSVLQGGWHGKAPVTVTCDNGDAGRFTTSESADEITVTAGSTAGAEDTATFTFLDANGNTSNSAELTATVVEAPEAPGDVDAGTVAIFETSRVQVTELDGWPSGEVPSHVVSQGDTCHGYVRRAWKTGNNDGTYMDFQAGWKPGASEIIVETDEGTQVAIGITTTYSIPTPGSGGTTRHVDASVGSDGSGTEGSPYKFWATAIAALSANDVLVLRARSGSEVYPVNVQVGGATSTVNGCKVVVHPTDLAAGRRPRIHVQGGTFARYADDLNNGHWEVYQDLGSPHGKVWRTTQVVGTNKVVIGISYRTAAGELRRTYCYTNTPNTPGALACLTDTTYPRAKGEPNPTLSELDLYYGPGHYLHSDGRIYIRLSPLTASVGAKAVNAGAGLGSNPPWPWSEHMPASEDPNAVQLYITSSNTQGGSLSKPSSSINYGLRINNRSGWRIENLDFVGGGNIIEAHDGSNLLVRGVRVLGYVSANLEDDVIGNGVIVRTAHFIEAFDASTITVDRCELWGGQVPWYDWRENKGTLGIRGANMKFRVFGYGVGGSTVNRPAEFLVKNTLMYGHPVAIWQGGRAVSLKFHQSKMVMWGMDGSLAIQTPRSSLEYVRCQMFEWSYAGWVQQAQPDDGVMYFGYNLCTNVRPFMHDSGYWNTSYATNNAYMCGGSVVGHETYREIPKHYLYNNTSIGAHNHRHTPAVKNNGGSLVGMGAGSGACMWPSNRNNAFLEWISRNNIAVVRPNGSLGSDRSPWGPGKDSHVGVIFHPNHVGWSRGGSFVSYSSNYNIYHRGSGMPTISGDSNGVITTVNSGTTENARTTIAQVRTDTNQENNGSIEDPLFVGAWDATKPDSELHANAFWCLQDGSPAASGGDTTDRSWRDVDFGTQITYAGNSWRGCMDPDASDVEQQVGPLGPLPSDG